VLGIAIYREMTLLGEKGVILYKEYTKQGNLGGVVPKSDLQMENFGMKLAVGLRIWQWASCA
jgi:hypothetical protein